MTYCGEALAVKSQERERLAVSLRCRSWGCEECSPLRHKQLVAEALGGKPRIFLTLTSKRRSNITATMAAKELANAWRLLRLRIMRRYKRKAFPFICVFQATKLGWPHLHILARTGFIDQKWLSEQMNELTGSPIVDIRLIKSSQQAANYCARYCGRETERFGTSKRYWQSQDYDQRPEPEARTDFDPRVKWERQIEAMDRWCASQQSQGWWVTRIANHKASAVRLW